MTSNETMDTIARIAFGVLGIASGLWLMRPKQNRAAYKRKRARRFGVSIEAMDALFAPCENAVFDGFNRVMAVFVGGAGVGMLASGLPVPWPQAKAVAPLMMLGFVLAMLLTGGLQLIFTAKAFVYMRRLYCVNPATWRPGWLTAFEPVWGRLFGLIFTSLIGALAYVVLSSALTAVTQTAR